LSEFKISVSWKGFVSRMFEKLICRERPLADGYQ
jgi:hypothetical protein